MWTVALRVASGGLHRAATLDACEIRNALGTDAATALPPLLALRPVTICLPEYVLRALELIANDHGQTLDDCLYGELIDFAGAMCSHVAQRIPGYRAAYFFPGRE